MGFSPANFGRNYKFRQPLAIFSSIEKIMVTRPESGALKKKLQSQGEQKGHLPSMKTSCPYIGLKT